MARNDKTIINAEILPEGEPPVEFAPGTPGAELFADAEPTVVPFDDGTDAILNDPFSGIEDPVQKAALVEQAKAQADVPAPAALSASEARQEAMLAAILKLASAQTAIVERQESVRQLGYNEIKPDSPWNPEGKRDRAKFRRQTSLHGITLNPLTHSEEEIILFNKLKPGRYIDRHVEVRVTQDGAVDLSWKGARVDARIEMYSRFPQMALLLRAVIAEREAKEARLKAGRYDDDDSLEG